MQLKYVKMWLKPNLWHIGKYNWWKSIFHMKISEFTFPTLFIDWTWVSGAGFYPEITFVHVNLPVLRWKCCTNIWSDGGTWRTAWRLQLEHEWSCLCKNPGISVNSTLPRLINISIQKNETDDIQMLISSFGSVSDIIYIITVCASL